jgi:hypothetical protein
MIRIASRIGLELEATAYRTYEEHVDENRGVSFVCCDSKQNAGIFV